MLMSPKPRMGRRKSSGRALGFAAVRGVELRTCRNRVEIEAVAEMSRELTDVRDVGHHVPADLTLEADGVLVDGRPFRADAHGTADVDGRDGGRATEVTIQIGESRDAAEAVRRPALKGIAARAVVIDTGCGTEHCSWIRRPRNTDPRIELYWDRFHKPAIALAVRRIVLRHHAVDLARALGRDHAAAVPRARYDESNECVRQNFAGHGIAGASGATNTGRFVEHWGLAAPRFIEPLEAERRRFAAAVVGMR